MMRSSAAPARKGGVDPDSPFASLGALREALEKLADEVDGSFDRPRSIGQGLV